MGASRIFWTHCTICPYSKNDPVRSTVSEILSDAFAYLRVSRQPLAWRGLRALGQVCGRLMGQTTILFRTGVLISIFVLAGLAYQQHRLNTLLQERIDRLESSRQLAYKLQLEDRYAEITIPANSVQTVRVQL